MIHVTLEDVRLEACNRLGVRLADFRNLHANRGARSTAREMVCRICSEHGLYKHGDVADFIGYTSASTAAHAARRFASKAEADPTTAEAYKDVVRALECVEVPA